MSTADSMITGAVRTSWSSVNPGRPGLEPRSTISSDNSVSTVSSIASGSGSTASSVSSSSNPYSRLIDVEATADVITSLAQPIDVPVDSSLPDSSNAAPSDLHLQPPRQPQPSAATPSHLEHGPPLTPAPNEASASSPFRASALRILSPQLRDTPTLSREHTPIGSTPTLASLPSSPSRGSTSVRIATEPSALSATSDTSRAQITFAPSTSPKAKISERAVCNDASSIGSSRSWVRDADSSSLCSRRSSCWSSSGYETEDPEDGEVYKPGVNSDVPEFLDRRPEPPGAQIWIDRDDPRQLIVNVTLPGFSLENITVAFRRHHRLHVLADQYGENGGHYERTISLGPDVSSRSNRAAFDGTTLRVFIDRRAPRPQVTTTTATLAEGTAAAVPVAGSPTSSSTSSSLPSPLLDGSPRSAVSFLGDEPTDAPIVMCSTGPLETKKRSKSLTGPEGARAAARAARDEAMQRAKEAYQSMSISKVGRKLPFRREKDGSIEDRSVSTSAMESLRMPDRSGTIKGRSHSPPSMSSSTDSAASQSISETSTASDASSPSRPAFMGRNLTLRAREKQTFVQASVLAEAADEQPETSTPKFEKTQEECELLRASSV